MADGAVLAQMKGVRLTLGGAPLFEGVDLALVKGERASLVGANGAGKSTLMRMFAGLAAPDAGEIAFAKGAKIALTPQEPDLAAHATLRDYVRAPSVDRDGSRAALPAHEAEAALNEFDLDPDRAPARLSGGETRRAALARAFAADPDILLLDEPTNHLDIPAIEALEDRLRAFSGAALIISHDRRFLERITTTTFWLRRNRVIRNDKGYGDFDAWAERVEAEEARAFAKLETQLKAEEHWLQRGVTARRSRNERRRRKLMAMRAARRERKSSTARVAIEAGQAEESGRLVVEAKGIAKSFGDRAIVRDLSLRIMRGDRVGIVGPNGAGKTTLIEILLKRAPPDSGGVRHGANLEIAYIDQARALLDPTVTIWDALTPGGGDQVMVRGRPRHIASYAKDFLFTGSQLRQPICALSGGERNRVALAVALAKPSNVLVLDEPTNDLDMETLDALEDMLAEYDGTVLIVSHDRAFLDGVTTQILGSIGEGRWVETPGGYADFEREHPRRAPPPSPAPKTPPRASSTPRQATKLSYKEERRAAELADKLPALGAEIAKLEADLADPALFARDAAAFQRTAARLEAARAELDAGETEWLEIEERRGALESARES
ncbi:MAG: ABC-F family ATP-binding cassette domain-containing protein [Hyphomonadaceae bacterium]